MPVNVNLSPPKQELPPLDYVCGIIECHGNFGWYSSHGLKYPIFQIKLLADNIDLLQKCANVIGLPENVHEYKVGNRHFATLVVRRPSSLDLLISKIDQRLWGRKKRLFEVWRDQYNRYRLIKQYNVSQRTT